jgi:DNA-binding NarL/FixJ family response regulator/class 3 adenylate cyclase
MIRAVGTRALPSGTVTFLFTDVEGSTQLLHALGADAYATALAAHRATLRAAFAAHGGVEVDTQGDAFFVAFPTAPGAMAAARAAADALSQGPIRVRIGLHTGTPLLTDEGYVGPDVNVGARIAAAGHGGQILVSAATAALLDASTLTDLGPHRLKDLPAPERIFQADEGDHPPLKALHQTNLPVPAARRDPVRVVVAEDLMLTRAGLVRLLGDARFDVVGEAEDLDGLLRAVRSQSPDAVIVDIRMPPTHTDEGIVAAQRIRAEHPGTAVLVLSQYLEPGYAMRLLEEHPEGVGYLLKERVFDVVNLVDALRRLADGECVVDPTIVSRLVKRRRREDPVEALTDREREVLSLVAEGLSNGAIAERLVVTERTVEAHTKQIFEKLGLESDPTSNRRVLAVLTFLRSAAPDP